MQCVKYNTDWNINSKHKAQTTRAMANNCTDVVTVAEYSSILPISICIFGVIAHVLLIVAFIKDPLKCFRNSGTYLVVNLAISDLLASLISPIFFLRHDLTSLCPWQLATVFLNLASISVSTLTVAAISIDRFLMTVYPIKHRVLTKGKLIVVWIASTWLISSGLPAMVFFHSTISSVGVSSFILRYFATAVILFASVMYGLTYYKLKKQSKNLAVEHISNRQEQTRMMKEKRFLRTISFIACIQIVCVVPSAIFFNSHTFGQSSPTSTHIFATLFHIFATLFHANFAVNPVVYVLRLPNYRKTFYVLYCCTSRQR